MDLTFIYGKEMIEKCIYPLEVCFSNIKKNDRLPRASKKWFQPKKSFILKVF